jgi:hypothetical protein
MGGKLRQQLLAGASAFCWSIWLSRKDVVLDKTSIKSFFRYYTEEPTGYGHGHN